MNASRDYGLVEGVISSLPLFGNASRDALHTVARRCWIVPAPRGTALVRIGAHVPGVFAVAYGTVKLALRNGGAEERLLRLVAARQVFAEGAALLGRPSPYDAVALAESKLVVIPSPTLFELIERDARFARGLVISLAQRKLELCAEIGSAALHTGLERLATYLLQLDGVQLPSSKTLVAARLGMKKETLSRLLARLTREGVLEMNGREVRVLDRARLLALAG